MNHLLNLGLCFAVVTITICSFLTGLLILQCWTFGSHYEKYKFSLEIEMYELR